MAQSFTSDYRVERVIIASSEVTSTSTFSTVTIDHDLGYVPFIRYFIQHDSGQHVEGSPIDPQPDTPDFVNIQASVTTTQLIFDVEQYTGAALTIYYRIYTEEVEL